MKGILLLAGHGECPRADTHECAAVNFLPREVGCTSCPIRTIVPSLLLRHTVKSKAIPVTGNGGL
jgi:hypothetical protein